MNMKVPWGLSGLSETERSEFNALIKDLEVATIENIAFSGERLKGGPSPVTQHLLAGSTSRGADYFAHRFDAEAKLMGEDGEPVAEIKSSILVTFRVDAEREISTKVLEATGPMALHMAYPHIRESVLSLALRLGFPGVVLPSIVFLPENGAAATDAPKLEGDPRQGQ